MSYERLETRKGCHAKLCEKADPLKALGCVASYLRNGNFYLINDSKAEQMSMLRHGSGFGQVFGADSWPPFSDSSPTRSVPSSCLQERFSWFSLPYLGQFSFRRSLTRIFMHELTQRYNGNK